MMTAKRTLALAVLLGGGTLLLAMRGGPAVNASPATPVDGATQPWTRAQTVEPADLVKELAGRTGRKPAVVCVGFQALYRAGHVPGASFHGPASSAAGLADLKAWAQGLPRSSDIVVYCGCCPEAQCPNLQPAFSALHDMGFTHVRVLMLPNNFATDWVGKGYQLETR